MWSCVHVSRVPEPTREVFVILALFLPQLTFAEGAKLDSKLWYSPAISSEESLIHVTPLAQGLQGMHEYKIAFTARSRAAAFVSPEQPVHSFESLATLPSEHIHIGSQAGRVYRLVLREDSKVFALLMVLLEYVTQPSSREDCPCTMPAGANLQAAYPELRHIQLDTPEGLIAGLGYALTRPGHTFQFLSVSRVCPWAGRACTAYTSGSSVPPAPGCPRPLPPSRRPARCYRAKRIHVRARARYRTMVF